MKLIATQLLMLSFAAASQAQTPPGVVTGVSVRNDTSAPLREMARLPLPPRPDHAVRAKPSVASSHVDGSDPVVEQSIAPFSMPGTILNFDGIPIASSSCGCAPPDPNGAVGRTQYVQAVNVAYQVFNKTTGASVLGPVSLASLWTGFGGVCTTNGFGDPIVLYDHLADRWFISFFAGAGTTPTDDCVAVSTTSDATGSYNRYDFHLGSNYFDMLKTGIWPDAYYVAADVFNAAGTAYLGPQPFALNRTAMLAGASAGFVSTGITVGPTEDFYMPAELDGSTLPPPGAPETFVGWPGDGTYHLYHFHPDFTTPANSTFTLFATPAAAAFTDLCPSTTACVPQTGTSNRLAGLGGRLMYRLPYRNFGDHESVVGNYSVSSGGVAGVRWFELRNVTSGPVTVFQESTYQPDTTWRWTGSAAMDQQGNLAIGFSASSASISPQIRYAGRLAGDPLNTLAQGEAHLFDGTGSQTGSSNRWGDYSAMSIDPVDDCTFWYTNEYYATSGQFNWRTRIGSFSFGQCVAATTNILSSAGSTILSAGSNGVLDPGETVTVSFAVQNTGGPGTICTTSATTGTLHATGGVTNPSPASQNYGALCPNGPAASRDFTFKVDPNLACGATVTASLVMTDGATNYGTVAYTFVTGTTAITFSQDFDGVTAPALPVGWVATNAGGPAPLWVTSTATPDTAPNDAFVDDPAVVSDKRLDTPSIFITTASAQVNFRHNYNLDNGFDGGVLEVSSPNVNAGAFTDITNAAVGGSFVSGGYTGTIYTGYQSPIAGRNAWTGNFPAYFTTVANLGPNVAGQTIKLRFRMASDNNTSGTGWGIDAILITEPACAPTLLVTTVGDHNDGVCDAADCTLREAITAANAGAGYIIGFAPGVTGTIQLASALPILSKNVSLQGPGANLLTVRRNAGGAYRIFTVNPGVVASFSGLTITNGDATGSLGGGIFNDHDTLTLMNCAVSGNTAYSGGGIFIQGATSGAASLTMSNSTISANSATGGLGEAGAIYNNGVNAGTALLSLTNCTVSGNTAVNIPSTAAIENFASNGTASATLTNCTFNGNAVYTDHATLILHNTLFASSAGANLSNSGGTITSQGHNLSSDAAGGDAGTGPGGFLNGTGDKRNTNPLLGPLASDGGPTTTHALLVGSPAIDAGDNADFPATDQRGVLRPIDGNGDSNAVPDIGAFEYLPPPVWRSVRTHAGAGPLPIVLNPTAGGNGPSGPSLESRQGGVRLVEVVFAYPITLANPAAVTVGGRSTVGGILQPSVNYAVTPALASSTTLALTFPSPLPDATCYTINVAGALVGPAGVPLSGDLDCMVRSLDGDATGSGDVNLSDAVLIKSKVAVPTSASSAPQLDLNLSGGNIDLADALAAKGRVAHPAFKALCP